HPYRSRPNCDSLVAFAKEDGLAFLGKDQAARDSVCVNGYKVALFLGWTCDAEGHHRSPGNYHWYRQDAGGNWSHKPGRGAATHRDQSNQPITNPETADKGTCPGNIGSPPIPQYGEFCGYFCVTKATSVGRPSDDDHPQGPS